MVIYSIPNWLVNIHQSKNNCLDFFAGVSMKTTSLIKLQRQMCLEYSLRSMNDNQYRMDTQSNNNEYKGPIDYIANNTSI